MVDAGEESWRNGDAGLLLDLADEPVNDAFTELENSAGRLPVTVVLPADAKDSSVFPNNAPATLTEWRGDVVMMVSSWEPVGWSPLYECRRRVGASG